MQFSMINLLSGRRHQLGALFLMRGETFLETIEAGGMAIIMLVRGAATVTRQRQGAQVGLHLNAQTGAPLWLTSPGVYCIVAKDSVLGLRVLRTGDATHTT